MLWCWLLFSIFRSQVPKGYRGGIVSDWRTPLNSIMWAIFWLKTMWYDRNLQSSYWMDLVVWLFSQLRLQGQGWNLKHNCIEFWKHFDNNISFLPPPNMNKYANAPFLCLLRFNCTMRLFFFPEQLCLYEMFVQLRLQSVSFLQSHMSELRQPHLAILVWSLQFDPDYYYTLRASCCFDSTQVLQSCLDTPTKI